MWEVFIHKTKNKAGHRFGFVRFKEVHDVQRLERQLDNSIFLGGIKMFVNRPKFERDKGNRRYQLHTLKHGKEITQEVDKVGQKTNGTGVRLRFYVEVARGVTPVQGILSSQKVVLQGDSILVQSPVILNPTEEHKEWLQKAWVGRLKNRGMFERVEEELRWVLEPDIKPRYWVDDWVILPNLGDERVSCLVNDERMNGSTPLLDLQMWSHHIRPTHRLAWVLIWGLLPSAWEEVYMAKVVAELGELVEVDEMVEERRRLDAARILIRTQLRPGIATEVPAVIDGVEVGLYIVEDIHGLGMKKRHNHSTTWFPPSPLSTEPNTPISLADQSPGAEIEGASMDGGFDSSDGGFSTKRRHTHSLLVGNDQPTQPIGHLDWSAADRPDVTQLHGDNKLVENEFIQALSNGELIQERKILIALSHNGTCEDMQKEKGNQSQRGAGEEQGEAAIELAELNQKQKGGQPNCVEIPPPLLVGPKFQTEGGGLGPANNRPNYLCCQILCLKKRK